MKNRDKRLLDAFSDKSSQIDPKFKRNLRQRMLKKTHKKHRYAMPKLVLAPLAVVAILAVTIFASTQQASAPHQNPFQPKTVSAQELIQKSDAAKQREAGAEITFFHSSENTISGPKLSSCQSGGVLPPGRMEVYGYRAPDGVKEMYYRKSIDEDGTVRFIDSVYDNSKKELFEPKLFLTQPYFESVGDYLKTVDISGNKPAYYLVDKNGKRLNKSAPMYPVIRNGKSVYDFYLQSNIDAVQNGIDGAGTNAECWPNGIKPDSNSVENTAVAPTFHPTINRIVMDAQSYEVIGSSQYVDSVAPENMLYESSTELTTGNISSEKAESIMTAAGYDKAHALSDIPHRAD